MLSNIKALSQMLCGHYVNVSNIFCYLILITLNEVCWYKLYVHHFKRIILFYLRIFSYTIYLLHHWQNVHSSLNFSLIIIQMVDSNVCKFLDVILHCLLNVFFAIKVIFSAKIFSCFSFFKSLHILIMTRIHVTSLKFFYMWNSAACTSVFIQSWLNSIFLLFYINILYKYWRGKNNDIRAWILLFELYHLVSQ